MNMKAVVLHEIGPAEALKFQDWPHPNPAPGHVLVRVRATGVCFRDVVDRKGGFPFMKLPVVPGHEFAGDVVELGDGVDSLHRGDRVVNLLYSPCGACRYCRTGHDPRCIESHFSFGITADGGYAEYVSAPLRSLVPLPRDIPYVQACFLACTAGAALRALRTHAQVKPGESVLITGASGGVGLHAMQVARALGARVVAVTTSEAKVDALRQMGAEDVVVSRDLAFHKDVKARTTTGVDVALDCVGAPTFNASLRSLRPLGRLVIIGNVTITHTEVNPGLLILREPSITGSSGCTRQDLLQIFEWVSQGIVKPVVAGTLPLESASLAHARLEAKGVVGRLVLTP